MSVLVRMFKDGIIIRLIAPFRQDIYKDYMVQASEMARPFVAEGYHMVHASLVWDGE